MEPVDLPLSRFRSEIRLVSLILNRVEPRGTVSEAELALEAVFVYVKEERGVSHVEDIERRYSSCI